jgi:D-alanyl-D-alanine carboxypeptidase (penicillin-binding protein 5/6)
VQETSVEQEVSEESVIQNITVYPENVTAETAFAYCLDSQHFAYEKNTDVKINPASITKLLTVLYALEIAPKELEITVGDELNLLQPYSSVAGIKCGRKYTLEQLIIAMLLPSGNDAAYSVAAGAARYATQQDLSAREAVDWFISNMNDYAVKLGCTDTHFTVPDGLAYEDHYTTSGDLVIIAENALKSEVISKYIALTEFSFTAENGVEHFWKNTNAHLHNDSPYYIECVTGMKTGSLGKYSLLVSAEINEKTYIIGIFGALSHNERYENSTVIINALLDAETEHK